MVPRYQICLVGSTAVDYENRKIQEIQPKILVVRSPRNTTTAINTQLLSFRFRDHLDSATVLFILLAINNFSCNLQWWTIKDLPLNWNA
jgi:hypothetical protein